MRSSMFRYQWSLSLSLVLSLLGPIACGGGPAQPRLERIESVFGSVVSRTELSYVDDRLDKLVRYKADGSENYTWKLSYTDGNISSMERSGAAGKPRAVNVEWANDGMKSIEHSYDGRLGREAVFSYSDDKVSKLVYRRFSDAGRIGRATEYRYMHNDDDRVSSIAGTQEGSANTINSQFQYKDGQLEEATQKNSGGASPSQDIYSFEYDDQERLTKVDEGELTWRLDYEEGRISEILTGSGGKTRYFYGDGSVDGPLVAADIPFYRFFDLEGSSKHRSHFDFLRELLGD